MVTKALLAKWNGKQKTDGLKWIVNQISHSSHWLLTKALRRSLGEKHSGFESPKHIHIFHKYQCDNQFLKLTFPAFKISTWRWEIISLSSHSHVPAIQPDNLPKANSASSLSPRLTSSDLLKKILNSTPFAVVYLPGREIWCYQHDLIWSWHFQCNFADIR